MRVLHLWTKANVACGVSRVLKCLLETETDIELFFYFENGDNANYFKQYNNVYFFKGKYFLTKLFELLTFCIKNQIDIIHSHHRYYDLLAYLLNKLLKNVKTVTTVHYHSYDKKLLSYKANMLIAVSDEIKRMLIKNYKIKEEKIITLYNPVDNKVKEITIDPVELKKKLLIEENKTIVGYIGRFDYSVKYLNIITKAIPKILELNKNIIFLFIGNGIDRIRLLNETLSFKENIKIIDSIQHIGNYYNIIDVLISPSPIEPFGLTVIEAGLFSKPVIVNTNGAFKNYLADGKTAIFFNNSDDLVVKLLNLISNNELMSELGSKLNQYITINHSLEKYIKILREIYLTLLLK